MSVAVTTFAIFAASQVGTPGPANMALMVTGARFGLRAALPFVAGVAVGKQFIIWPIGFGVMGLIAGVPWLFTALKFASAAYILYLAWRIAGMRIAPGSGAGAAPAFASGLIVHPLNPKAWAMVTTGFTNFVTPGTPALEATAVIAACLFLVQLVLHPLWCWGGARIASVLSGGRGERILMLTLAGLTVASVLVVFLKGDL